MFIGALLQGDARHAEARPLVEAARAGHLNVCTTGILSEVYGALTWIEAQPRHSPTEAANAVRLLEEEPSAIEILPDSLAAALKMLELAETHGLTAPCAQRGEAPANGNWKHAGWWRNTK